MAEFPALIRPDSITDLLLVRGNRNTPLQGPHMIAKAFWSLWLTDVPPLPPGKGSKVPE